VRVATVEVRTVDADQEVAMIARIWWAIALLGLLSLIAGVILVFKPSHSLATLAVILGIFILIDGIAELISSFGRDEGNRALAAIVGVLGIIVGLILIRHPTHAVTALGLLIGIWLVAAGVIRLIRAFAVGISVLWHAAVAAVEIVAGIIIVSDPHIGYATLAVLTGIWLILNGIGLIGVGLASRHAAAELAAAPAR
jgi:uncharacterized membrane protein HdeD (DUF308 family)